jgi:SAM-dependent methyltransferase
MEKKRSTDMEEDKGVESFYEERIKKYKDNPYLMCGWESEAAAKQRLHELYTLYTQNSKIYKEAKGQRPINIYDVGCGVGFLYEYLRESQGLTNKEAVYFGTDTKSFFVATTLKKLKYPEDSAIIHNSFNLKSGKEPLFDVAFVSGLFNHNRENQNFMEEALLNLLDLCKAVVFNYIQEKRYGVKGYNPLEMACILVSVDNKKKIVNRASMASSIPGEVVYFIET